MTNPNLIEFPYWDDDLEPDDSHVVCSDEKHWTIEKIEPMTFDELTLLRIIKTRMNYIKSE